MSDFYGVGIDHVTCVSSDHVTYFYDHDFVIYDFVILNGFDVAISYDKIR